MIPSAPTTIKPRPPRIPLDQMAIDCIPAELKERAQWVLWSWSWKKKSGKWDKPPRQPDGSMAESNDPSTWVTFDAAVAAYQTGRFDGLGYVFTADDPFTGIDLDGCINADGVISPWAQEILDAFLTYFELSPSQTGGKGLIRGTLPKGCSKAKNLDVPAVCDKAPAIEVYDRGRYFTVTGHPIGELRPIADCQSQLDALLLKYGFIEKPKQTAPPSSNGHNKTFSGIPTGAPADAAEIAEALRFVGGADDYYSWIECGMALHSWDTSSGYGLWCDWSRTSDKYSEDVCREKWATFDASGGIKIGTLYFHAQNGGWANPNKRPTSPPPSGEGTPEETKRKWPMPKKASQLSKTARAVSWLWQGGIARGHFTLIYALPKAGKTTITELLLRAIQHEQEYLGKPVTPCKILMVTEESETISNARVTRHSLTDDLSFINQPVTFQTTRDDWYSLIQHFLECHDAEPFDMLVIDTLTGLWPVKDENQASDVSAALLPLVQLAKRGIAIVLIHHSGKAIQGEGKGARGSTALTAFVDILLELRRYDATTKADRRRVLSGWGRFDEIPSELVIALAEDGRSYIVQGDGPTVATRDIIIKLADAMPHEPPGVTVDEIAEKTGVKDHGTLRAALNQGAFVRTGRGKKGDPYRYYRGNPFTNQASNGQNADADGN